MCPSLSLPRSFLLIISIFAYCVPAARILTRDSRKSLPERSSRRNFFDARKMIWSKASRSFKIYAACQLFGRKHKSFLAFDFPCMCRFPISFFVWRKNQHNRTMLETLSYILHRVAVFAETCKFNEVSLRLLVLIPFLFFRDCYLLNVNELP